VLVDRLLARLEPEEVRQLADRPVVGQPRGDVWPLRRIGTLREEAAELVERRRRLPQDSVRVVVDEADPVQYFQK